jgi:diacylglycerol kinase family enzyme
MTNYLLVGNPTAQSGLNEIRIAKAHEAIVAKGARCELFSTLPGGATVAALGKQLAHNAPDVVVAMGGDGTFREVGAALMDSGLAGQIVMGMLPTGTANDQGRSFGLIAGDDALERNVEVLLRGRTTPLDAVDLTGLALDGQEQFRAWSFDSVGWGLSARVLLERNKDRAFVEKLGPLRLVYRDLMVYAGAFSRVFMDSFVTDHTFSVLLRVDGKEHELHGVTDLIIKNTRVYAGAWVLDRSSEPNDGLVEVVPFRNQADWVAKAIVDHDGNPLPDVLRDPGGVVAKDLLRGAEIELSFKGGVLPLAQFDGEEADPSPRARIRVHPRALSLVVP